MCGVNAEWAEDIMIRALCEYKSVLTEFYALEETAAESPKNEELFEQVKEDAIGMAGFFRSFGDFYIFGGHSPMHEAKVLEEKVFGMNFDFLFFKKRGAK